MPGRDRYPFNPKLDNCAKGWEAARHDWIVMSDSNLMLPPDYLDRIMARAEASTASSGPADRRRDRQLLAGRSRQVSLTPTRRASSTRWTRAGWASRKARRWPCAGPCWDRAGGYAAMGTEPAEDAAATKAVRRLGLNVRLARPPFMQPLGVRSALSVWARQVRWARLRRATFPLLFAPEILSGLFAPLLLLAVACHGAGWPMLPVLLGFAAAWYACEAALARVAGWPLTAWSPMAWLVRDAALPAVWFAAWAGRSFSWRGQSLEAVASQSTRPA